jgi:hypothetical protein
MISVLLAAALGAAAPTAITVAQHVVLLEPVQNQLIVRESVVLRNDAKVVRNGTLRFYVPDSVLSPASVSATVPGSAAVTQTAVKTKEPGVFRVDSPLQPGETRFEVSYTAPFSSPGVFSGKILDREERAWLAVPQGVVLKGDGLSPPRQEPNTRTSIYGVKGREYKVELEAVEAPDEEDSGPSLDQILPSIYGRVYAILGLAFGVLALGFVLHYRRSGS